MISASNYIVIIPAFNAEKKIGTTIAGVLSVVKDPEKILVIDDHSHDRTSEIAEEFGVVLLKHSKNLGKGAALKTGFNFALGRRYPFVITMDADNQHDPAIIPFFIKKMEAGNYDLILGRREINRRVMPLDRYFSNQMTSLSISILCGRRIRDSQCGYRLVNLNLYDKICVTTDHFEAESEILIEYLKHGGKIGQLPVPTIYADESSSIRRVIDTFRYGKMFFKKIWI